MHTHVHTVGRTTRAGEAAKRRVLDEGTRKRRQQRQLESLEKDNFHDDPHAAFAHLAAKTKLPVFSDGSESECVCVFTILYNVLFSREAQEDTVQCRPL